MKYHIVTFGCQMNTADSEEMSGHLDARGFTAVPSQEEADIVLVNTCTVRDHAEHRALSLLGRLKEWKDARKGRLIVLTGCAAERIKDQVSWRLPQVDLVVGAKDIERFGERLDEFFKGEFDWGKENKESFGESPPATPGSPTAHVTIMRGCNYNCSYCIVPSVRGREIYRPPETILAELRAKVGAGAKEALLLGQTVNSYRFNGTDFAGLLRKADAVPGLKRLRYMSPHPYYMDEPLVRTMAELPSVCEHVHLPVQSGSDRILKRMKRNYARARYLAIVETFRRLIPGLSVTTDFIAGFPGETEEDFEMTLSLVREAGFDGAYCFKYSPRPGTEAAALPDDVPETAKEERLARLIEITEELSRKRAASLKGTRQEVLVEEAGPGRAFGQTRGSWKVTVALPDGTAARPGDLLPVRVEEASGRTLAAVPA